MSSKFSKQIIRSIREGDTTNYLQKLYDNEFVKTKSFICSNSGTLEDAKDIFQESLMVLISHVKLGKFKEEYEVGGFLYIVSKNAWKKKAGREKHTEEITDKNTYSYSPYGSMFNDERKKIINDLLSELGENCKNILTSSMFYDMSMKEIAKKFGYSNEVSVKTRNYKCKKRLAKLIHQDPKLENYLKESLYV